MVSSTVVCPLSSVGLLIVGLAGGFLAGFFIKPTSAKAQMLNDLTIDANPEIKAKLVEEINASEIRAFLQYLTTKPHLAGTPADLEQAQYLKDTWDKQGLDRTQLYPYDILLSYPDENEPNRIVLYDGEDIVAMSMISEKVVRPEENRTDIVPPYNGFSASGTPQGDPVYVNYARIEDFQWLNDTKGLNLKGKICIARYGKIFRGTKATLSAQYGCAGLVLYSDPEDYVSPYEEGVYPESWNLPGWGVQRGNALEGDGDPLTPGYPAIKSAYRIDKKDAGLPTIPIQPIGYDDAAVFLGGMGGEDAPTEWQGGMAITYKIGPGYTNPNKSLQMIVNTKTTNVTTYNVIGFIEGAIEPDRYVLIGNHRDAWVFGGVDPSSGTAMMMEVSRVYGKLLGEGWRPRRSVVFCSWGAEEHGLIGSSEWVEVENPDPDPAQVDLGRLTVYDTWLARDPENGKPRIQMLGARSDYASFVGQIGVTSADLHYSYDTAIVDCYPLYHSMHDSFYLVDTHIDPGFRYHRAVAQYTAELARRLADDFMLPYDVREYATAVDGYIRDVENTYRDILTENDLKSPLDMLISAGRGFVESADIFHSQLEEARNSGNPILVRMLNDQMMQLERAFIDPLGLPGRELVRHVVYAPSKHDAYSGASFPGLTDALWEVLNTVTDAVDEQEKWEAVHKQLAVLAYFIDGASASLQRATDF